MTTVVNLHRIPGATRYSLPPGHIYIGRPSIWGNPFRVGTRLGEYERGMAVLAFEEWVRTQPELITKAKRVLKDKVLVCFCAPAACHGDVWARIVDAD